MEVKEMTWEELILNYDFLKFTLDGLIDEKNNLKEDRYKIVKNYTTFFTGNPHLKIDFTNHILYLDEPVKISNWYNSRFIEFYIVYEWNDSKLFFEVRHNPFFNEIEAKKYVKDLKNKGGK